VDALLMLPDNRVVAISEKLSGVRWTVDAPVLLVPPGPPIACRMLLLSLPPAGGSEVRVQGVDPRAVPGATIYDNGTVLTPPLRLTGAYDGRQLILSEPATSVPEPRQQFSARALPGTVCPDPGDASFTDEQRQAALEYVEAQSEVGAVWVSEDERVLNVSFTQGLRRHEQAIRAVYPGPLCVVEAPVSRAELKAIQGRLHEDEDLQADHIQILEIGVSQDTVRVLVAAAGPAQVELLRDRYGSRVAVRSWLRRVAPE
jgi:hypothetical protein